MFHEPQLWTSATLGYWEYSGKEKPPPDKYKVISMGYFDNFKKSILPSIIQEEDLLQDIFKSTFPYRTKDSDVYSSKTCTS